VSEGGETFRRFAPQAGELWMGDHAYANPPGIAFVKASEAEVLVSDNQDAPPLYDINSKRERQAIVFRRNIEADVS
jgi:hypothetical protein